tara:strand:- start:287 stop:544 length:258 start_codon:yes stop_codon:yes gene_type:complete
MTSSNPKFDNAIKLAAIVVRSCLAVVCALISHIHFQAGDIVPFVFWLMLGGQFFMSREAVLKLFKVKRIVIISVLLILILITYAI